MSKPGSWVMRLLAGVLLVGLAGCGSGPSPDITAPPQNEFVFGLLMVGPANDHGWSQAHFEAGRYVEKNVSGTRMVYVDKVNPSDRPGTTPAQLANDLLARGARLIIFNSDDMKDGALEFARAHRDIPVIHISGDSAWPEGRDYARLPNVANVMGRMEHGAAMAGFAAAMTTRTGRIGYLGPLINDETRRLAAATYLGARHAWTQVLKRNPGQLRFKVSWIGFWFNIPGVTADPTQVADGFFSSGFDVVVSGIDTTEGLAEAKKFSTPDKPAYAIPYDYVNACAEAEGVCLGVPYYNWGPAYVQ
ncbi:MAG TPA: BMP family ABC transporter substrate-binding protein, partial [Acidobacteriota bacterium]|nr:BMP family ABC transporter substrate-binding protein [Acidobacteriota bacterium]